MINENIKEFSKDVQLLIGARIQEARKAKKISQVEMSAYLDITRKQFSRIECGESACDVAKLFMICQYLEVSADYILFGKNENAPSDGVHMILCPVIL